MKKYRKTVLDYLEVQPLFRERKNRERGLVNLLLDKYPVLKALPKETLIEFGHDFCSMDRCWRQILEKTPRLRGSDYGEKEELEVAVQRELGYPVK